MKQDSTISHPLSDQDMIELAARTATLALSGKKDEVQKAFSQVPRHRFWAFRELVIMAVAVFKVTREATIYAVN